jgi:hypothetical protein
MSNVENLDSYVAWSYVAYQNIYFTYEYPGRITIIFTNTSHKRVFGNIVLALCKLMFIGVSQILLHCD